MIDYSHLNAPSFALRRIMAAHYLRSCRRVVEIGGGKNPIYGYLNDGVGRQYWIVDPECEPVYHNGVTHLQIGVEQFEFRAIDPAKATAGLCLLGLELHDSSGRAIKNIIDNIPRFQMIVVDLVKGNDVASQQYERIADKAIKEQFVPIVSLTLEYQHDRGYERQVKTPSPSFYKKRLFTVLTQD